MKRSFRNKLLLLLTAALLLLPLRGAVAAPGSLLHNSNLELAQQTQLSSGVFWSYSLNDRVTENYIEYIPNSMVKPIVAYGDYIYGGNSLSRLESILAGRGQRVIAAVNADYFNMSTLVPLSTVIEDGVLKSSEGESWSSSIGFYEDGRAIIGYMGLTMRLNANGENYVISTLNKELTASAQDMQLFSPDYATTTRANIPAYCAVLRVESGFVGINRTVSAYVESVKTVQGAADIPADRLVLAIAQSSGNEGAKSALLNMSAGQQLTLSFSGDAAWESVRYAVGGGEKLLSNGQVVAPEFSIGMTTPLSPRTALGVKADGSFIMYSVDGRQAGYSAGASLTDVAQRLRELGCVDAVNLDGGGSTTLSAVYPGKESLSTVNRPSGGSLRTCANYILLVNNGYQGGTARRLHLYPFDTLILAGSSLNLEVSATNEDFLPAALPYGGLEYSLNNYDLGWVDEAGRFTAGNRAGSGYVYAQNGDVSGAARVTVVDSVDSVSLVYKASGQLVGNEITLFGGGSTELAVRAVYNHMDIVADAASFNWNLSGDIGTIDVNGRLAVNRGVGEGSAVLTASLGSKSISVPVRISNKGQLLEDFENITTRQGGEWTLSSNLDKALVRYGAASARLDYDFSRGASGRISVPMSLSLADGPSHLSFWVYGDQSDNQLLASVTRDGQIEELPAVTMDFNGWQYVSLLLPSGTTALNSLELVKYGNATGSIYIDHIMCAHGQYEDNEPPQVSLSQAENQITGLVTDTMDKELKASSMRLRYDGAALDFSYDAASGKLTATLPASDGRAHRLSLTAWDKSGNIGGTALDIAASQAQAQPFVDMQGHWAESYTTYLYQRGIINGIESAKGLSYAPDTNMNRAQFAVIMCNWLGIDTAAYAQVSLPFDDKGSIASWAYPSVQAMYALGVTKGSAANGKLNFNPASPISRAEAMTMIGRTQNRGWAEAPLNFADNASIPDWAAPYVRNLVARQVVGGVGDNRLAPNDYVTRSQVAKMLYSLM